MPICAAMSVIGRSVACRAISMAGGRGTGRDHARRTGTARRPHDVSQAVPLRPTLAGTRSGQTGARGPAGGRRKGALPCRRPMASSSTSGPMPARSTPAPTTTSSRTSTPSARSGTYDAAVITKDDNGKIHVNKDETTTRHGAWGGAAAGALVGILFPPSIIGSAIVGAAIGGVSGHLWKGMSRTDVKEFGEAIDAGEAALVIVGETTIEDAIEKAAAQGPEEGGQGAPGRQEGRRQGGAGGRAVDLLIRRPLAPAADHDRRPRAVPGRRRPGGARRPGLGAQDRRPAPEGLPAPGAVRLRAGLPDPGAPAPERPRWPSALRRHVRAGRPRQPAAGLDDPHDGGLHLHLLGHRRSQLVDGPSRSASPRSPPWDSPSPTGPGRIWIAFVEATIGLGLVALLISYLPTIYSAYNGREKGANRLRPIAGSPPSAAGFPSDPAPHRQPREPRALAERSRLDARPGADPHRLPDPHLLPRVRHRAVVGRHRRDGARRVGPGLRRLRRRTSARSSPTSRRGR